VTETLYTEKLKQAYCFISKLERNRQETEILGLSFEVCAQPTRSLRDRNIKCNRQMKTDRLITTPYNYVGNVAVKLHLFHISVQDGDECSNRYPFHLTPFQLNTSHRIKGKNFQPLGADTGHNININITPTYDAFFFLLSKEILKRSCFGNCIYFYPQR
jgi:hypothetical protein